MRLQERYHAGGARIDGVWAVQVCVILTSSPHLTTHLVFFSPHLLQGMIYAKEGANEHNREAIAYQKTISAKDANPMKLDRSAVVARHGGGPSLEQKRRGGLAMKAMYALREPPPWPTLPPHPPLPTLPTHSWRSSG